MECIGETVCITNSSKNGLTVRIVDGCLLMPTSNDNKYQLLVGKREFKIFDCKRLDLEILVDATITLEAE